MPERAEESLRHGVTKHRIKTLPKRARLSEIRFHDLLRTCATLLLTRNVNPKKVSETLGHSTMAITLGTYSDMLASMRDRAAPAMEVAIS